MSETQYVPYKDGSPVRFLGKCRRCKKAHRAEGVMEIERRFKSYGRLSGHGMVDKWKGAWVLSIRCDCRDGTVTNDLTSVQLEQVYVAAETTHECGARCINATGPACACKCRGKNHGSK